MNNDLMAGENTDGTGDGISPVPFHYGIIESLKFPVSVIGTDGNLIYGNRSFHEMMNGAGKDVRLDMAHPLFPEYRMRVARAYLNALKGREDSCFAVINMPDGTQRPVELHLSPLYDQEKITSILAMIKFVDKRLLSFDRNTLSLISEENFQYDTLHFEFSPVPIVRINEEREIIRVSQSFEGFFGYIQNEIFGKNRLTIDAVFAGSADQVRKAIGNILNGEVPFVRIGEVKAVTKDNIEKILNLTLYPIIHENRIMSIEITIEDITKICELKDEVNYLNREQLLRDITKGFLHSLNNIINVITSKTQLLLQITEKPSVLEGIQLIENAAGEITDQARRIQNFIKDKSDIFDEREESLFTVIEDAIEFSKMQFKVADKERKRNISISKKYFTGATIKSDTKLLREIIISTILKVSLFIRKKGTIVITLKEMNDLYLTVSVEKEKDQAAQGLTHEGAGAFPDVNIRQVAEKLKLKIIEEESADAYSIKVIFPSKMLVNRQAKEQKGFEYRIRGQNIIIAEDEKTLQKIIYELFDKMGNRVMVFDNGDEALAEFKKGRYDILITDYDIEGLTGIELAARVKEISQSTITILLSGWMITDLDAYRNVIDLFLPKPFKLDVLIKEIANLLKTKKEIPSS